MRLIEADALKEILDKIPAQSIENVDGRAYVLIRLSTVFEIIKQLPSAEPERKKGKWIDDKCSACGYRVEPWNNTPYCPSCGAYMRGEQDE